MRQLGLPHAGLPFSRPVVDRQAAEGEELLHLPAVLSRSLAEHEHVAEQEALPLHHAPPALTLQVAVVDEAAPGAADHHAAVLLADLAVQRLHLSLEGSQQGRVRVDLAVVTSAPLLGTGGSRRRSRGHHRRGDDDSRGSRSRSGSGSSDIGSSSGSWRVLARHARCLRCFEPLEDLVVFIEAVVAVVAVAAPRRCSRTLHRLLRPLVLHACNCGSVIIAVLLVVGRRSGCLLLSGTPTVGLRSRLAVHSLRLAARCRPLVVVVSCGSHLLLPILLLLLMLLLLSPLGRLPLRCCSSLNWPLLPRSVLLLLLLRLLLLCPPLAELWPVVSCCGAGVAPPAVLHDDVAAAQLLSLADLEQQGVGRLSADEAAQPVLVVGGVQLDGVGHDAQALGQRHARDVRGRDDQHGSHCRRPWHRSRRSAG